MKSLTLCLSAGRSGTQKLSEILSTIPNMTSEHEGYPGFHSVRLDNIINTMVGHDFVLDKLSQWKDKEHVAHTGHMLWEGFVEQFFAEGITPNVIILRRPYREIALSMFRLNWIPGKNKLIRPWYIGPDESGSLQFDNWQKSHPYQLCYWWCLETERRIEYYLPLLKALGSKIYTITTKQMLNLVQFNLMLKYFDLPTINTIDTNKVNHLESYREFPLYRTLNIEIPPDSILADLEADVHTRIPKEFVPVKKTVMEIDVNDALGVTSQIVKNTGDALAQKTIILADSISYHTKPKSLEIG